MDMQDKEFDELFRSKLDGFEAVPSARVWNDIAGKLNAPKKRKVLLTFLSLAANIIVLIGAGLLFIPKKQPVKIKQDNIVKTALPSIDTTFSIVSQIAKVVPDTQMIIPGVIHQVSRHKVRVNGKSIATNNNTLPKHLLVIKQENQPLISSASQTQAFNNNAIVPVIIDPVIEQRPAGKEAEIAALGSSEKDPPVKVKPGIHNLGGLVNALIAKVDKRKDKVIEFSDNEDGESKLTGINLGIIKIKKER